MSIKDLRFFNLNLRKIQFTEKHLNLSIIFLLFRYLSFLRFVKNLYFLLFTKNNFKENLRVKKYIYIVSNIVLIV